MSERRRPHILAVLGCFVLLATARAAASIERLNARVLLAIDGEVNSAVSRGEIPGAVVRLETSGRVYERAYGFSSIKPARERMTVRTVFDVASLTKVLATAPAIWLLVQRGQISLDVPVIKYLPEFASENITIRHLLTHTSGLPPALELTGDWSGYDDAIRLATKQEPLYRPGIVFQYGDVNFILLGEVVRRVAGLPLDEFVEKEIFAPLNMSDTWFQRQSIAIRDVSRTAPTELVHGVMSRGIVHDPTARRMGGVAGHAGLFTTARDAAVFCRMLLRGGAPVFKKEIVAQMTSVQSPSRVFVRRTAGFDYESTYSQPRGALFPVGSYGHTGYTGTSLWLDPRSHTFYVLLSNRVHPDGRGTALRLEYRVGTLVGRLSGYTRLVSSRVCVASQPGSVSNGIDVLKATRFASLRDQRVAVVANASATDRAGNPVIDLLLATPEVDLRAILRTDNNEGASCTTLHGSFKKLHDPHAIAQVDVIVFDVQGNGGRFSEDLDALPEVMCAAAMAKKRLMILDRVNPAGGKTLEGPLVRTMDTPSLPVRHGMTIGELAFMLRDFLSLDLDLVVVKTMGWSRGMSPEGTGLPVINTPPRSRSLSEAGLVVALSSLRTTFAIGLGSGAHQLVGAPYVDGVLLAKTLPPLPGITISPARFTPRDGRFAGLACGGVRLNVTQPAAFRPVATAFVIASAIGKLYRPQIARESLPDYLRSTNAASTVRTATKSWSSAIDTFGTLREAYLIYK